MPRGVIKDPDLSAEYVRSLLSYCRTTGSLRWKISRRGSAKAGDEAGGVVLGYRRIKLTGRSLLAHRVIWLIVTGSWPASQVDHRDVDALNNRWDNLRLATNAENSRNRRGHKDAVTAMKGVYRASSGNKFNSAITINYQQKNLGRFDTPEQAKAAYAEAVQKYHGEFGRVA